MPRPSAPRLLAAVVAALLAAAPQLADAQWKWKDRSGRVQYSDLPPPPGTPDADILSRPNPRASGARGGVASFSAAPASAASAAASGALAPKTLDPELEARRKKVEADQLARVKADQERVAAARADNCKRAQEAMRTIDSGVRMARTNEKGEREILDDKQRADEAKRVRETIASDCK